MKIKLEKTEERKGGEACHNFFKWLVPVYQLSDWFDRGYINTSQCSLFLSLRKMVWGVQACEIEESTNFFVQWTYLWDCPHIGASRKEWKTCLMWTWCVEKMFCNPADWLWQTFDISAVFTFGKTHIIFRKTSWTFKNLYLKSNHDWVTTQSFSIAAFHFSEFRSVNHYPWNFKCAVKKKTNELGLAWQNMARNHHIHGRKKVTLSYSDLEGTLEKIKQLKMTKSLCVSWPLSRKQAAKITFALLKRKTLQSIIYPPEKKFIRTSSIWYEVHVIIVCCLPTPFLHSEGISPAKFSKSSAWPKCHFLHPFKPGLGL